MASQDWFEKDFYSTLGVSSDADADTIKKAYRKLSRTYHPDVNAGDEAAELKFKEVGEAYSVLSDPEQRQQYDAIRSMAHGGARFAPGAGGSAAGFEDLLGGLFTQGAHAGPGMRFGAPGGAGADPHVEDILRMFGGAGGFGNQGASFGQGGFGDQFAGYGAPTGPRAGRDVQAQATITFAQAAQGDTLTLTTGDGESITTRIPAGVKDGQKIRLRGKGAQGDPGAARGDLMLTVHVTPHPVFGRDGNNLTVDLPVSFAEAALGATVEVPALDGSTLKVKVAPGTPSGRVLRLKGRGIAAKAGAGDLLAKVQVMVPTELSDAARAAVETLAAETTDDPRADLMSRAKTASRG